MIEVEDHDGVGWLHIFRLLNKLDGEVEIEDFFTFELVILLVRRKLLLLELHDFFHDLLYIFERRRLQNIVDSTIGQGLLCIGEFRIAGQHHNRNILCMKLREGVESGQLRHVDVEENDIRCMAFDIEQQLFAVRNLDEAVLFRIQLLDHAF